MQSRGNAPALFMQQSHLSLWCQEITSIIYQPVLIWNHTVKMVNKHHGPLVSSAPYRSMHGHPRKFCQPQNLAMKQIYISEKDFVKWRWPRDYLSNDSTLQCLLNAIEIDLDGQQCGDCDLTSISIVMHTVFTFSDCSRSPLLSILPGCCSTPISTTPIAEKMMWICFIYTVDWNDSWHATLHRHTQLIVTTCWSSYSLAPMQHHYHQLKSYLKLQLYEENQ